MSSELPRCKTLRLAQRRRSRHAQSGAPFGAIAHRSQPGTTLESGRRATVPAASVTPLARSPAALVAPPSVSPAPLTPRHAGAHIGDRLVDEAPDRADHLGRRRQAGPCAAGPMAVRSGGCGFAARPRGGGGQLRAISSATRQRELGRSPEDPGACSTTMIDCGGSRHDAAPRRVAKMRTPACGDSRPEILRPRRTARSGARPRAPRAGPAASR